MGLNFIGCDDMGARQREWARRKRLQLRRLLGLKCSCCGSKDYRKLEFDIIIPVGNSDHHRKMDWSWRMSFYFQQYKKNNLQLLCGGSVDSCHNKKTCRENYKI
jgi:hypothetical protein